VIREIREIRGQKFGNEVVRASREKGLTTDCEDDTDGEKTILEIRLNGGRDDLSHQFRVETANENWVMATRMP
jgi:hypothetical protein